MQKFRVTLYISLVADKILRYFIISVSVQSRAPEQLSGLVQRIHPAPATQRGAFVLPLQRGGSRSPGAGGIGQQQAVLRGPSPPCAPRLHPALPYSSSLTQRRHVALPTATAARKPLSASNQPWRALPAGQQSAEMPRKGHRLKCPRK